MSASLAIALAVKACGGTIIAQVKQLTGRGTRKAQDVKIPGAVVDHVVVSPNQMMVTDIQFDRSYLGGSPFDCKNLPRVPLGPDKVIARRAGKELRPGVVTIFGFGASSDVPLVLAEQGCFDGGKIADYQFTTEHGPFGGPVMSGWQFSANLYPEALLDGPTQFDFIDGGNCKVAALSFAEFDAEGNVNVSRFGTANPGAGGFIDIAYNARDLVFTGTFTTSGLKVDIGQGGLKVVKEGTVRKFVSEVQEITYPVRKGVIERGQRALLITERAVFAIEAEGVVLNEIARGIDVKKDLLDLMAFKPQRVADPLPYMDESCFSA
jgi:propionate CoA-transferase